MKKNSKVFALAGIGALALVGGTFAYYTSTQSFDNEFKTTNFDTYVIEKFTPDDNWNPGVKVDKEITATNKGDGNVWVRVKFEEEWTKKDETTPFISFKTTTLEDQEKFNPTDADGGKAQQPDHDPEDGKDGYEDGIVNKENREESVVYKNFQYVVKEAPDSEPTSNADAKWYFNPADGYYYYTKTLAKGESTNKILDDVTLCNDTDMGKYTQVTKYAVVKQDDNGESEAPALDGNAWSTDKPDTVENGYDLYTYKAEELDEIYQGYANANYTLTITTEFVQADQKDDDTYGQAADAMKWDWYPGKKAGN